ncbi:DUF1570 domain-containing protein [Sorangium sp. So ce1182]|uniref:DUF1570 domain-containing protein n=1 Tax=Sorangium sp. So ce1182 TaxID=3133334 RepID=UPI003F60ED6D
MHRRLPAICLLLHAVWLLSITGCAAVPLAHRERSSGAWVRLRTEHFDLWTDLSGGEARRAAEALERTRAALVTAAWSKGAARRSTVRANVVVLASGLDFDRYADSRFTGVFSELGRPTIFLWGSPERWERREQLKDASTTSVLRHELVHQLAAGIYGRQPRWFAEGLAQLLESLVVSEDGTTAILGRPNLVALRNYRRQRTFGVRDALAWKSDEGLGEGAIHGLYGLSWLMVYWMYNTQPDAFAAYQGRLAAGVDPERAWQESFGALSLDELDKQLHHYARFGKFQEVNVPLEPVKTEPTPATITTADVHALRAQLALTGASIRADDALKEEARRELDRALRLEPANVLALRVLMQLERGLPIGEWISRLEEQVARRPDDGDAWLLLGQLLGRQDRDAEQVAALRRAVALLPGNANAYNDLAWALVNKGHPEEALPLATKAAMLAPWNASILDTYAANLFALGRCPDALRVQARAVDLISHRSQGSSGARWLTDKLAEYQRSCGQPAKSP